MRDEAARNLKRACRLTGASWAALVSAVSVRPEVLASWGLSNQKASLLERWLSTERGRGWFAALSKQNPKSTCKPPAELSLGVQRIRGYAGGGHRGIVVAGDVRRAGSDTAWLLLASLLQGADFTQPHRTLPTRPKAAAYDAHRALEGILADFLRLAGTQAGWLAIRRGDELVFASSRNATFDQHASLEFRSSGLLLRMQGRRETVLARRGRSEWAEVPPPLDESSNFWAAFPLVIGDRFIGAMATWGHKSPPSKQIEAIASSVQQAAQNVELVLTLDEAANQLRRLATLNEFALAISSAEELPAVASRVLDHLSALFPELHAVLLVPEIDGRWSHEFRIQDGELQERRLDAAQERLQWQGAPSSDESARATHVAPGIAADVTTFPLRYRESVVGVLRLEGVSEGALSRYDQSMLAVVASYIAGVVEHGRLRSETMERAQRLEQMVRQLREAELTASARLQAQQAAETRLVQAAKLVAVGEMAAGVAHELNNPLTTVTGFAELVLDETPTDAPYRADLEMVLHEAHRARAVVRRLLDFARQGERTRARADINEIVEDVLALMTHFIHTSGVQLGLRLQRPLPWISLDGNQIKQVLLNLLHNALHAMPSGGHLDVRTELQNRDGRDWIVVQVTDSGTGMEPQELERIFEPFYTTRADSGGTGLGLSVTYGIVSEHGGTIDVTSQRGGGSTFSVWLPA